MKSLPGASAEGRKCESLGIIIPYHPKYGEFNEIHHYIMWGYMCMDNNDNIRNCYMGV